MVEGKKPEVLAAEPWKDPTATPYIRIENVTKKFNDFVAVNHGFGSERGCV